MVLILIVVGVAVSLYKPGGGETSFEYVPMATTQQTVNTTVGSYNETTLYNEITTAPITQSTAPVTTTAQNTVASVSSMSSSEILSMLTDSINKTKAYTGSISVYHKESFDANVTQCTGGSVVANIANRLVGMVLSPSDETLNFSNGSATNSKGEAMTILLPQAGQFRLQLNHISSITAQNSGDEIIVNVKLNPESVGMYDVPAGNSAGVGYLDVGSLDLSILTVTHASLNYTGSTIKAHIRPDGYVSYAEYTIPMHVEGAAKSGMISGSAVFDGMQTEIWQFNW